MKDLDERLCEPDGNVLMFLPINFLATEVPWLRIVRDLGAFYTMA